jgi:hypothetical protein
MADVFVSYAHANRDRVEKIHDGLSRSGLDVWWDERLKAGDVYQFVIEQEILDAKCAVVAWSQAARNSLWVLAEANRALDENKLVQVKLDGVRPPLPFNALQMIDLSHWRGERGAAPFPDLENRTRATAAGQTPAPDPQAFKAPALQNLGSAASLGWLSIGLIYFQGLISLSAAPGGPLHHDAYADLTLAGFAVACVVLTLTLLRVVSTVLASRVRS